MSQLQGKLSEATLNALLSHLGQEATTSTTTSTQNATKTAGISDKELATQGLDVEALQHVRNTNAGMFL
jgi:hypothetical protein